MAQVVLVLNQPAWISVKFLDLGAGIAILPAFLTNYGSETFLLILSVFVGLCLVKLTWMKIAEYVIHLDSEKVSVLWTLLMGVCIVVSIAGSLYMNKDLLIGLLVWMVATVCSFCVDKYIAKES